MAMRLRDAGQSRDECLHGRTQLWARATRKSCHRRKHVPLSRRMTRSAAGTAGVEYVHQRQRTVDDASGLSDLSSLGEDDSLGAATDSRCTLQNKKVQRK